MARRPVLRRLTALALTGLMTSGLGAGLAACGGGGSGGGSDPQTLLQSGLAAQRKGDLDGARKFYDELLKQQPKNYYAHYELGVIAQSQNDNSTALSQYRAALAANPTYVPAMFNQATIYTKSDPTKAIAIYRKIVKIQPQSPTAYLDLGLLENANGQQQQALQDLATALKQQPALSHSIPAALLAKVRGANGSGSKGSGSKGSGTKSSSPSSKPSPSSS